MIPDEVKKMIMRNEPIKLNEISIYHFSMVQILGKIMAFL